MQYGLISNITGEIGQDIGSPVAQTSLTAPFPSPSFITQFSAIKFGVLEGYLCTEGEFLQIPSKFGEYELVRGVLSKRERGDKEHTLVQHGTYYHFI